MKTSVAKASPSEIDAFKADRTFASKLGVDGLAEPGPMQKVERLLARNAAAERAKDARTIATNLQGKPAGTSLGTGRDMKKSVAGVRAAQRKGGQPLTKLFGPDNEELPGAGGDLRKRRAR